MNSYYKNCSLCPRECKVDRELKKGFCGQSNIMKIASIEAHFGEEPPISGEKGSATVFFSGCTLKCSFCQNHQISYGGVGEYYSSGEVVKKLLELHKNGVHNVNFVTPDQFFPHTFDIVYKLREKNCNIPIVYNLSGFQKLEFITLADNYADIYLPDFKYSDNSLGKSLSKVDDYSNIALDAIYEMVKQKGFLNTFNENFNSDNSIKIASKGVLIRHLVLPGFIENSINALSMLFIEFGKNLPISVMSQYTPHKYQKEPSLNRYLTNDEYKKVTQHALELGFKNLFIQELNDNRDFLPDFEKERAFKGNQKNVE
ncbi:radical SAM protein [bacterium]|nr:radical SAM protein [bacterium]